jgi:hypothetical protein
MMFRWFFFVTDLRITCSSHVAITNPFRRPRALPSRCGWFCCGVRRECLNHPQSADVRWVTCCDLCRTMIKLSPNLIVWGWRSTVTIVLAFFKKWNRYWKGLWNRLGQHSNDQQRDAHPCRAMGSICGMIWTIRTHIPLVCIPWKFHG